MVLRHKYSLRATKARKLELDEEARDRKVQETEREVACLRRKLYQNGCDQETIVFNPVTEDFKKESEMLHPDIECIKLDGKEVFPAQRTKNNVLGQG